MNLSWKKKRGKNTRINSHSGRSTDADSREPRFSGSIIDLQQGRSGGGRRSCPPPPDPCRRTRVFVASRGGESIILALDLGARTEKLSSGKRFDRSIFFFFFFTFIRITFLLVPRSRRIDSRSEKFVLVRRVIAA